MNLVEKQRRQTLKLVFQNEKGKAWEKDIDFSGKGVLFIKVGTPDNPATDRDMDQAHEIIFEEFKLAKEQDRTPIIMGTEALSIEYIKMD